MMSRVTLFVALGLLFVSPLVRSEEGSKQVSTSCEAIDTIRIAGTPDPITDSIDGAVFFAQVRLWKLGYQGRITMGELDEPMREIIMNFQADREIPVTGALDEPTRKALRLPVEGVSSKRGNQIPVSFIGTWYSTDDDTSFIPELHITENCIVWRRLDFRRTDVTEVIESRYCAVEPERDRIGFTARRVEAVATREPWTTFRAPYDVTLTVKGELVELKARYLLADSVAASNRVQTQVYKKQ